MLRAFFHIGGPAIGLVGVLVGIVGTLLMSRQYHPFESFQVLTHVWKVLWRLITKGPSDARRLAYETSVIAEVNQENRARSLLGLYVLIFSFFIQTLGAILALLDVFVSASN